MEYLLFITQDLEAEPYVPEEDNIAEWVAEGERRGITLGGNRLRPPEHATIVRRREGEVLVTEGPFTESKEWVAGFDVVQSDDLDDLVEFVSRHPMARFGRIEIRPVWPLDL